jgi:DNA repair exonuclease SbcCD ATPase subunit
MAELKELQQALDGARADLESLAAGVKHYMDVHDRLAGRQGELAAEADRLEQQIGLTQQAAALLHSLSNLSRERLCEHLSRIVTTALQYVYGPDFKFEFELVTDKRGNTRLEYYVTSGDSIRTRPQDARGGGVVDVISIALRVGILSLMNNPPLPGPVILDEPGRHLDPESAVKLGEFLRFIAETTGRQFIVITHHEAIVPYAHAAFRVTQVDGTSRVERIA